jgi:pilin isopeptide linkage protein
MKADEFTFELYYADENGNSYDDYPYDTVTNIAGLDGVATKFEFTSTASYTKPTKAYVLIVEKAGNLGGVTYDSREYVVEITVTDNLEGKLVAEITSIVDKNGKQYDAVYFDNYYKAAGTTAAPIVGNKTMTGNRGMNAGEFTFNLYQTDENYSIEGLTPVQTTTNVAGAKDETTNFAFDAIPYETAGTYYYVVTETKGTAGGVTYDERTYRVNVEVVDNLDGTMTATVNYVDGTVAFSNSYYAKPAIVVLGGYKTMHGRDMKADEFTFELYHSDKDGNKFTKYKYNRATNNVSNKDGKIFYYGDYGATSYSDAYGAYILEEDNTSALLLKQNTSFKNNAASLTCNE